MIPADDRWQKRRWQLRTETRADYIKYIYEIIRGHKEMIYIYEAAGRRMPGISEQFAECIGSEKQMLGIAQDELRRTVGR